MTDTNQTPFDALGGEEILSQLVDRFYEKVSRHPDLSPLFPDDLTETARKQKQFLTQFLGGPSLYTEEHGHPMLRARHMPFVITPVQAEAWLECMERAMDDIGITGLIREFMLERLTMTAHHMVNQPL
ncbi:hemoglobin-like protein HbO [Halalkalibacter wakoensis JCM 9140]|uniref:Hemoglobin-like protein HbO n=1 Tax=Halalkalibacter wakoensis JCM 9140 TaxID=1236970 RepID=W4Q0Q4_9BACI|nr:globin [Halalkalibacter wakoensis]GAE25308.1 hemoglobin-like protein HbO [Halalkalibacter wakoensis JCM 9140]